MAEKQATFAWSDKMVMGDNRSKSKNTSWTRPRFNTRMNAKAQQAIARIEDTFHSLGVEI